LFPYNYGLEFVSAASSPQRTGAQVQATTAAITRAGRSQSWPRLADQEAGRPRRL